MVRFRMFKINVEQFAILANELPTDIEELSLETRLGFKAAENCKVAPMAKFIIAKGGTPILLIEVCCEFEIHPDDWKNMLSKDEVVVSKETLEYLTAQTVGVTRGILYCKTENTPFSIFVLPSINVASMIKGDVVISFKEDEQNSFG